MDNLLNRYFVYFQIVDYTPENEEEEVSEEFGVHFFTAARGKGNNYVKNDTYHTITVRDIVRKLRTPTTVEVSKTRTATHFSDIFL